LKKKSKILFDRPLTDVTS